MAYYMLFTKDANTWAPEFGDEDKYCVTEEARDWIRCERDVIGNKTVTLKANTKVVRFSSVPSRKQLADMALELNEA